jgi:hypothetical protein
MYISSMYGGEVVSKTIVWGLESNQGPRKRQMKIWPLLGLDVLKQSMPSAVGGEFEIRCPPYDDW